MRETELDHPKHLMSQARFTKVDVEDYDALQNVIWERIVLDVGNAMMAGILNLGASDIRNEKPRLRDKRALDSTLSGERLLELDSRLDNQCARK